MELSLIPSLKSFSPCLDILPPAQRDLWLHLREASQMGFVLYGGTAIALRLGHRQSVDFDFFTERPFHQDRLIQRLPILENALALQNLEGTFTLSLDAHGKGQAPVRVSFFTVGTGRIHDPEWTTDGTMLVASMEDLLAHKLKVMMQRLEKKDYLDIHAMVTQGYRLEDGLAGARALFGRSFQPAEALKALTWFKGGDLQELSAKVKKDLAVAVAQVGNLSPIPEVRRILGVGEE